MIAARRVLVLSANGLAAWSWRRGHVAVDARFASDADGHAAFADYLRQHRRSRFHLLADVADETFHAEDLPHTRGSDRTAMIQRKIDRHCEFTVLATAMDQGRRRDGRRDDRFLFAALARPALLAPWRATLAATGTALVGIYSVPQAIITLAAALDGFQPERLVVTFDAAGLRQTFFTDGRLRFSRLTALADGDDIAARCRAEAVNLRHYLAGRRLIAHDRTLPVAVLATAAQLDALRAGCHNDAELQFEFHDLASVSAQLGLRSAPPATHCDATLVHLLMRATPSAQFAPDDDLRSDRQRTLRRLLAGIGVGIGAALLIFAVHQAVELRRLDQATAQFERQLAASRQRLQFAESSQASLPLAADTLAALAQRHDTLARRAAGPLPLLREIGAALDTLPDIDIQRLDWAIVGSAGDGPNLAVTAAPAAAFAPRAEAGGGMGYAVVDIHGTLPASSAADPQRQQALLDAFATRLRQSTNLDVRLIERPADSASGKSLHGNGEIAAAAVPQFILRAGQPL